MSTNRSYSTLNLWQRVGITILGTVAIALLLWLLAGHWPPGIDYHVYYFPAGRMWLDHDPALQQFYSNDFHAPWIVWLSGAFAIWGYSLGKAWLWLISVVCLIYGIITFSRPGRPRGWSVIFSLFNFHTYDLLFRGQIDAFNVLGVTLAWTALNKRQPWLLGLAYLSMMMKPPNSIPIAIFFLWLSWQWWTIRQVITTLVIPGVVFIISLIAAPTWLLEIAQNIKVPIGFNAWVTTIWRAQQILGISWIIPTIIVATAVGLAIWAWLHTDRISEETRRLAQMMLVISLTFVITPYSLSYQFVLLLAVVMPYLAGWRLEVYMLLYVLTFLPILRIFIGIGNTWIDIIFVFAVFATTIVCLIQPHRDRQMGWVPEPAKPD